MRNSNRWRMLAALGLALAAVPATARAQVTVISGHGPVLDGSFLDGFLAALKRNGFTVARSNDTPELTQQQGFTDGDGNPVSWAQMVEGSIFRLTIGTPGDKPRNGNTRAVIYGVTVPGYRDTLSAYEVAHAARALNFGVTRFMGPNWSAEYPALPRPDYNTDVTIRAGNVAGLLLRPDADTLEVPRATYTDSRPPQSRSIPGFGKPTIRNRVSGANFTYDDDDDQYLNDDKNVTLFEGAKAVRVRVNFAPVPTRAADPARIVDLDAHDAPALFERSEDRETRGRETGDPDTDRGRPKPLRRRVKGP